MSSIGRTLSIDYLKSLQNPVPASERSTPTTTRNGGAKADSSQLSTAARATSTLQQLQQTEPAKYSQVTQQIAQNLQSASQDAQSEGNAQAAGQLNQLATSFTEASSSGQLPNTQSLAQAFTGDSGSNSLNPAAIVLSTLSNSGSGGSL
jgi:hypothetical protein